MLYMEFCDVCHLAYIETLGNFISSIFSCNGSTNNLLALSHSWCWEVTNVNMLENCPTLCKGDGIILPAFCVLCLVHSLHSFLFMTSTFYTVSSMNDQTWMFPTSVCQNSVYGPPVTSYLVYYFKSYIPRTFTPPT
jgi:hypothetical protein